MVKVRSGNIKVAIAAQNKGTPTASCAATLYHMEVLAFGSAVGHATSEHQQSAVKLDNLSLLLPPTCLS